MPQERILKIKGMTCVLLSILETKIRGVLLHWNYLPNFLKKKKKKKLSTKLKRPPLISMLDMPYMPFYD